MERFSQQHLQGLRKRVQIWSAALTIVLMVAPSMAQAATTLLVNNESFQTIDSGDGTSNRELRFGSSALWLQWSVANSRFELSRSLQVGGTLTATGAVIAKSYLSGASLRISGPGEVHGNLTASGSFRADGDMTINDDAGATDATLTFGNSSGNQTLKFLNTAQKFQFTRGISVQGSISGSSLTIDGNASITGALLVKGNIKGKANISGATLNVDGNVNIRGVNYNFQTSQGGSNTYLKNDGAGNLTWTSVSIGNSSGAIMTLHPEYQGATYFSSGSTIIGQLTSNFDSTNFQNYYRWTSSKGVLHDEWIAVRFRIPKNFIGWDSAAPIQFRYRTGVASNANNYLNIKMLDSTNTAVALTGGATLSNTSWTKANITGPQAAGTFTAGSGATIYVKLASDSTGFADAGDLQLNIRTSSP